MKLFYVFMTIPFVLAAASHAGSSRCSSLKYPDHRLGTIFEEGAYSSSAAVRDGHGGLCVSVASISKDEGRWISYKPRVVDQIVVSAKQQAFEYNVCNFFLEHHKGYFSEAIAHQAIEYLIVHNGNVSGKLTREIICPIPLK